VRCRLIAACLLGFVSSGAFADPGWFESGDTLLRKDLQVLNDAQVIRLPLNQWPIPRAAVRYAMDNVKEHFALNEAVILALSRVRRRLGQKQDAIEIGISATAGQASLLRDFDSTGREDGELSARAGFESQRLGLSIRATAVTNPNDQQEVRLDGSNATLAIGNWLLSANTLDRFWGPAHESSLILSNNARPIPTLMIERAEARPFETRWLNWLGPWRFSFGVGRMENDRADIDAPLFMAWRVMIMPSNDIELGFSRTAQFCGRQLACTLNTFGNMLAGNDNVGIDATPENEPGNQMAGFDIRWSSPIGSFPYAVYSQMIGEDESSYLPAKYLAQFGLETWKPLRSGALLQFFAEYADSTCSATGEHGPYFNCAYNQGRFNIEGYRHRGRSIGHTTDRDARSYSVGGSMTDTRGGLWSATARAVELNRDGDFDFRNTVSALRANYRALEFGWRGELVNQALSIDVGMESLEPTGMDRDLGAFGFIRWQYDFAP
jgi:hypothetical protein